MNQIHVNGDGFLVSVLSLNDGENFLHLFVFHEREGDAIYTVQPFSEKMQRRLEGKEEGNIDENLTKELHAAEHRLGPNTCLTYVVVNKDFRTSVMITSA